MKIIKQPKHDHFKAPYIKPICKNCKHYYIGGSIFEASAQERIQEGQGYCAKYLKLDPVTGDPIHTRAQDARSEAGICGRPGRLFEPENKLVTVFKTQAPHINVIVARTTTALILLMYLISNHLRTH